MYSLLLVCRINIDKELNSNLFLSNFLLTLKTTIKKYYGENEEMFILFQYHFLILKDINISKTTTPLIL